MVGMLRGTWSTPLTQFIARDETKSRIYFRLKRQNTCPFAFAATAAPSPGFSTAASSFPAVLETFPPMLLVQQRNTTDQTIEQRPQASSQNFQAKRSASLTNRNRGPSQKPNKPRRNARGLTKCGKGAEEKRFLPKNCPPLEPTLEMEKLAPPQMRCGVQRPSPLMNGHPGYDDRATAAPPITSPDPNERGGRGGGGGHGVGGERELWTMGDTTTTRHNFFWGFHSSKIKSGYTEVDCGRCYVSETPTEQTKHDKHKVA